MKVTVLDMQPIEPAIGGGRMRLFGLYQGLGSDMATTYVGTYDWPGPGYRRHFLSPTLEEINVPLSEAHFLLAETRRLEAGGRIVIDSIFHEQAHLSPTYVATACEAAAHADAVVFSHPWAYLPVQTAIDPDRQLIVYDSHNVEGALRLQLLDDGGVGTEIARGVIKLEHELCHAAHLVLACSHEDRLQFARLYGVSVSKIAVVPNGVFTRQVRPADEVTMRKAGLQFSSPTRPVAIFIGSNYPPNVEAARFITNELAPKMREVDFVIAGNVGDALADAQTTRQKNVRITGTIDEQDKRALLAAADVAINPMFAGSGTNIKMFDFMAAGLPIIATTIGARGIETSQPGFVVCERAYFESRLRALLANSEERAKLGQAARAEAERWFSWERISADLGDLLRRRCTVHVGKRSKPPFFSVVVATYDRHAMLTKLADRLAMQTWHDFEVIIVDQSEEPWPDRDRFPELDIAYVRRDIKGAVMARNVGASLARGEVIAFTDDDCEPVTGWLEASRRYFDDPRTVGVEGLVESAKISDPAWREVTNRTFRGIGFMTANFFIRREAFNLINGFDIRFDQPHFREDTDLGWRARELGNIPFSETAWVFHPPHRREIDRESLHSRAAFFTKDALLLKKHPERYRELFMREGHWRETTGFWPNFLRGVEQYDVELPDYILELKPEKF
jgi:glycosyltransferase involved in cell wall biosynthesis/GT2 family glycosyltransferase